MRRVAFVGNCQVQALSQLYERFSGLGDQVRYLAGYEMLDDGGTAAHPFGVRRRGLPVRRGLASTGAPRKI
jgi:hypothetical protein